MGRLVEERIQLAIHALLDRDANRAQTVIDHDREINEFQVEIDNRCLTMCALHQPVAVDLRSIVAGAKIASDLERVGDLAVNIAEATQRYLNHTPVKALASIHTMALLAQAMLHDALDSFVSHNVGTARSVLDRDDTLDDLKMSESRTLDSADERDKARRGQHPFLRKPAVALSKGDDAFVAAVPDRLDEAPIVSKLLDECLRDHRCCG